MVVTHANPDVPVGYAVGSGDNTDSEDVDEAISQGDARWARRRAKEMQQWRVARSRLREVASPEAWSLVEVS